MQPENMNVDALDVWSPLVDQRFAISGVDAHSQLSSYDAELALVHKAYVMAKRRRNMLAPACRVPSEVLSAIFALAQLDWIPEYSAQEGDEGVYDLGWIYVSHVCSHWRDVALRTPSLWNTINCLALPHRSAFSVYHRSKRLPLSLTVRTNTNLYDYEELKRAATAWLTPIVCSRINAVTLLDCVDEDLALVAAVCSQHMPELSCLEVCAEVDETVQCLPARFCSGARPAKVTLFGCLPHWNTTLLSPALTHLSLHAGTSVNGALLPPWAHFAALLSSLQLLEELHLDDIFPPVLFNTPYTVVALPSSLKTLDLAASRYCYQCLKFFVSLQIPPKSQVNIVMKEIEPPQFVEDIVTELPSALKMLHGTDENDALPAELVVDPFTVDIYMDELRGESWTTDTIRDSHVRATSGPRAHMSVHPGEALQDAWERSALRVIPHLLTLPLHNLSALALSRVAVEVLVQGGHVSGLSAAKGVRLGLEVRGYAMLLAVLCVGDLDRGFDLLPALEIVHLHIGASDSKTGISESDCTSDMLALAYFVTERRDGGAPLKEIVVQKGLENWDVWDAVRSVVTVNFVAFNT
ncbi:hypothetical protein PENSPDRAFT_732797 [Peniophora sp. CONT]|nr:hypothetical protein PENSPDRAFT_732797 [Peniophora sp. CONT]